MKVFHLFLLITCLNAELSFAQKPDTVIVNNYLKKATYYISQNPDSAYIFIEKALNLANSLSSDKHVSLAMQIYGNYYIQKEDFGKALESFIVALKIEEKRKDEIRIADLNDEIGYVYKIMEKFEKSMGFYSKALSIYERYRDTINIAKSLCHIGVLNGYREYCETRTDEQKKEDCKIALSFILRASELCEKVGDKNGLMKCYVNTGWIYNKLGESEKSLTYLLNALQYYKEKGSREDILNTLYNAARTYSRLKQYNEAISCYLECINESKKYNLTSGIQYVYEALGDNYSSIKDYKKARDYYIKYMILRDSIYNSEKSKQIFELETKYQSEKKEKEIVQLTAQKKQRTLVVYSLLGFIVLVLSIAFFIIRTIHQKRIITEQKIQHLEKERQLLATQSVLQGEEAERGRLAKDLHDGLGGLLSGVKLSLTNLKGNYTLSDENVKKFDHTLNLLDASIKEMRRISHNMMPEALIKFGLKDALADFCSNMEKQIKLNFKAYGIEKRINQDIEISLYRIAQELINNAIKHSKASELIVQLITEENRINLTVQDNGIGFNTSILSSSKGAGIANIRSRVSAFNGRMDIYSEPGKGTDISVEFNIIV